MKKNLIKTLIISLTINIIILIINLISFYAFNQVVFSFKNNFGGEYDVSFTFGGLIIERIYPLISIDEINSIVPYTKISFDLISFIVSLLVVFIIIFIFLKFKEWLKKYVNQNKS